MHLCSIKMSNVEITACSPAEDETLLFVISDPVEQLETFDFLDTLVQLADAAFEDRRFVKLPVVSHNSLIVKGQRFTTFAMPLFSSRRTLPQRDVGISGCPFLFCTYTSINAAPFVWFDVLCAVSRCTSYRKVSFPNVTKACHVCRTVPAHQDCLTTYHRAAD